MGRIFGTDGARGVANTEISCELAMNIGRATAMVISEEIGRKPTVIIGTDTRISSEMLQAAMAAGLTSVGADVISIGVVPTPAVAYLVTQQHADAGIMLSASHNSYEYNGIKIFGAQGFKLTDAKEFELESIVLDQVKTPPIRWGWEIGRMRSGPELREYYIEHVAGTLTGDLSGIRVAVDCSNGSASATAQTLLERLGAQATILHENPTGININRDCGSTHIDNLAQFVQEHDFDAGIAFDGDADRCIAVDEIGKVVDGDVIMAVLAKDRKERGELHDDTVVATVMSNLGFFRFGRENGIHIETTKVGDRYVLERMLQKGYNLGGEQSGHVIQSDYLTTGDGQLTAIHLLSALKRSGKKLSELAAVMTVYPQVMRNFRADSAMKSLLGVDKGVQKILDETKEILGEDGRILVRASGTEPLIRVMIEGQDQEQIEQMAAEVTEKLEDRLLQNEEYKRLGHI